MKPLTRVPVSKSASRAQFNRKSGLTKPANVAVGPMRGGWRF